MKQHGLRANPRVELPPGRYQLRVGVRESGAGEMGTVFYDLDVPDFTRGRLSMSGLLLTAPSAQRTFTVQADPIAAKLLPGAATSRRTFTTSDVLSLYAEIYENASSGPAAPRRCHDAADRRDGTRRCPSLTRSSSAVRRSSSDKSATFVVSAGTAAERLSRLAAICCASNAQLRGETGR